MSDLADELQAIAARAGKGYFDPRTFAATILKASNRLKALEAIVASVETGCSVEELTREGLVG